VLPCGSVGPQWVCHTKPTSNDFIIRYLQLAGMICWMTTMWGVSKQRIYLGERKIQKAGSVKMPTRSILEKERPLFRPAFGQTLGSPHVWQTSNAGPQSIKTCIELQRNLLAIHIYVESKRSQELRIGLRPASLTRSSARRWLSGPWAYMLNSRNQLRSLWRFSEARKGACASTRQS